MLESTATSIAAAREPECIIEKQGSERGDSQERRLALRRVAMGFRGQRSLSLHHFVASGTASEVDLAPAHPTVEAAVAVSKESAGEIITIQLRTKEKEESMLVHEYKAAPKSTQRQTFVRRIDEVVNNVQKQERDITNIVKEAKEIRRDVNDARKAVRRAHAIIDDALYRDARETGDDVSKEVYQRLAGIRAGFAEITAKTDETREKERARSSLERQLEEMQPDDTERVGADKVEIEALEWGLRYGRKMQPA